MTNLPQPSIEMEVLEIDTMESPWAAKATTNVPSFINQQWGSRNQQGYNWERHMLQQMGIEISPISQTR